MSGILRKQFKKWIYGHCPGFVGKFPYYNVKINFPKGSWSFLAACEQGVFEADNVRILQTLARPKTVFFDVGANIGLMAVPVLAHEPQCQVVSFEPSSNVLPYLKKTIEESPYRDRWILIPKAVGAISGRTIFSLSDQANSLFDGIRPTKRVSTIRQTEVDLTTLDETWQALGSPRVSHIKIDVEGGELEVLRGAKDCLRSEGPVVLLEWNSKNLSAYACSENELLKFAGEMGFALYSIPNFSQIHTERQLALHMAFSENFLLLPSHNPDDLTLLKF